MSRRLAVTVLGVVAVVLVVVWVADRTDWVEIQVPMPPKGEALTNPTYAAQRFVQRLGAIAVRDRVLNVPPSNAIIVLSAWNWGLSRERALRIERWVESGGRLVVDGSVRIDDEFTRWSGISETFRLSDKEDEDDRPQPCRQFEDRESARHWLCDSYAFLQLETRRQAEWLLRDPDAGIQALRVRVGAGSVAMVNADPFRERRLFDGEHGWLLVAAAQLRPGDEVHFLSEGEYPSLFALTWQHGAPVVMSGMVLVGLLLWRGSVRFGPPRPMPSGARRSLAEQIRGTGSFLVRRDGGEALHAAAVRALEEAARRRIPGYATLAVPQRTAALAAVTGLSADALTDAMFHADERRPHQLPATIAVLESARRKAHTGRMKSFHGTT